VTVGDPAGDGAGPPLARLLAMAYRLLIDGLHERLRGRGWHDVRPAFGFVLLAARDAPTTATDLGALMGTTKQAASKLVDTMEEAGYVARTVGADDARQRLVVLTARGVELLAAVEAIYAELEAGWSDVVGGAAVERMRRDLVRVLTRAHGGELPPVRPTW
jgi:DNA-binding MarR family transcriptional regulator